MTRNKMTRLKNQIRQMSDKLGSLKSERDALNDEIEYFTILIKEHYKKVDVDSLEGDYYKSVYDKHKKSATDWQALAKSFKPSRIRINKYTSKKFIKRLRTYLVN